MDRFLDRFSRIVRRTKPSTVLTPLQQAILHPFEERNMHPEVERVSRKLFDDGHYSQATFEAYKYLDKTVQGLASTTKTGKDLMMQAFSEVSPLIELTARSTVSERDEQEGYKFLFAGAVIAIRNPRGHEILNDAPDKCLDHLSLASLLLRRLDEVETV